MIDDLRLMIGRPLADWLELTGLLPTKQLDALRQEAEELLKIFNAIRGTARNRKS